ALHIMIAALEELRAAGRLSASMDAGVWAEAFWATLHGIVALNLTCPVFPTAPLDTVVEIALDAWLGTPQAAPQTARRAAQPRSVRSAAGVSKQKSADSQAASPVEPGNEPAASPSGSKSTKAPAKKAIGPGTKRKTASP
ncbi:MAG TPA: TetR-like C-terminal domain-containing protein, partial [Paraburkholderia sp.]